MKMYLILLAYEDEAFRHFAFLDFNVFPCCIGRNQQHRYKQIQFKHLKAIDFVFADDLHSHSTFPDHPVSKVDSEEKEAEFWINSAQKQLRERLEARINTC